MISVGHIMSQDPITVEGSASCQEAARLMRHRNVGEVIVTTGDSLSGMLTDRDITVRGVAEGRDLVDAPVSELCSTELSSLESSQSILEALALMRAKAVRRIPVVDDRGRPVGVVTLGDLALKLEPDSVLSAISSAPANT